MLKKHHRSLSASLLLLSAFCATVFLGQEMLISIVTLIVLSAELGISNGLFKKHDKNVKIEGKNKQEALLVNTYTDGVNLVEENGAVGMQIVSLLKAVKRLDATETNELRSCGAITASNSEKANLYSKPAFRLSDSFLCRTTCSSIGKAGRWINWT
ncbi:hypothetical protein ACFFNY_14150 [Paenibacillus hodogayensis]|uniref:DUF421 domain-containing protein n=1 Tax=Paenibacillus hodogayensis TaxID=279208 RepID=A0ABV5VWL0_9BACL